LHSFKTHEMNPKRAYEIAFVGLKQGEHHFKFELEDSFFVDKGASIDDELKAVVNVVLDKHKDFMMLNFVTDGTVNEHCDRCGNMLNITLWDEFKLVVKLVENPGEMNENEEDPDIFYIARSESHIDLSNWLYEFVLLSIPTQHICKNDDEGNSLCNKDVLAKLETMKINSQQKVENTIWKGLDKFKENNN
jgi:uncharacterized metal-binding protein YceD (DUF177 family)